MTYAELEAKRRCGELPYPNAAAQAQASEKWARKMLLQQQAAYAISVGIVANEKEFIAKHNKFLNTMRDVTGFRFKLNYDGTWSKHPPARNWAQAPVDEDRCEKAAEWYRSNASFYGPPA